MSGKEEWEKAKEYHEAYKDHERSCEVCQNFSEHLKRCKEGQRLFSESVKALNIARGIKE